MLTLLESAGDIANAQRELEARMSQGLPRVFTRTAGFPGGSQANLTIHTDGTYWYYSGDASEGTARRLNWFGLMTEHSTLPITVEVNTVPQGRPGQVAGFFARDNNAGQMYLLHSGRVGGGTKGVGKRAFSEWSKEPVREVLHGRRPLEGYIVMPLSGDGAHSYALRYVDRVAQFKEYVRSLIRREG